MVVDLHEFKNQFIREELNITESYGSISSFIDFGNVNFWFEEDRQDANNKALAHNEKLVIDLEGLKSFSKIFSKDIRFYYGHDPKKKGSISFLSATKHIFGRRRVFTKPIQRVKHHLEQKEEAFNTRETFTDEDGSFVYIPKCNFDVEIAVDAIRLADTYDTIALFFSDADFTVLARYLRQQGKQVILIKGGYITRDLRNEVDLIVNAQRIKKYITTIQKQKPGQ